MARRRAGKKHAVDDFLFDYYTLSAAKLERWHPGLGYALADAPEYIGLSGYTEFDEGVAADPGQLARRLKDLRWTRELLRRTGNRAARWGCFGLHEWAMVYRSNAVRHDFPLRLGVDGTNAVVEVNKLTCTHVDAFRFFTDPARPLNAEILTRDHQLEREQPGCLHANMDLYRLAFRMSPFIDSSLVLDCFELAIQIRRTDMEASPYDLSDLGYEPIRVETPEGKAIYVSRQREFAERAAPLRTRLLRSCEQLLLYSP